MIKAAAFTPDKIKDGRQYDFAVMPQTNGFMLEGGVTNLRKLEKVGWITLGVRRCNGIGGCAVDIALTPAGVEASKSWVMQGVTWRVPTMQREFVEVTGITNAQPTISIVEYTWKWVPTESGKALGMTPSEPRQEHAGFQLFDDG
ncbi:MAG TPA: hypothetical protein VGR73_12605 [Bryobacteraceae bacterium]|nr:hypothetical protein [Bryobacteraceae bacterium]